MRMIRTARINLNLLATSIASDALAAVAATHLDLRPAPTCFRFRRWPAHSGHSELEVNSSDSRPTTTLSQTRQIQHSSGHSPLIRVASEFAVMPVVTVTTTYRGCQWVNGKSSFP